MAQVRQITEAAAHVATSQEWARIPRTGDALEGLYRSQIFALLRAGAIRSAAIRAPGATRAGMRLIHVPSLRSWIASHVEVGPSGREVAQ